MTNRLKNEVLALVLAGWAVGAAAQEDCNARINAMATIIDIQSALNCLNSRTSAEFERARQEGKKDKRELAQQIADLEVMTTKVRNISLKEATGGAWKELPDSEAANACFLTSVRLPQQGLCQISWQGAQKHWAYNVSDPNAAGFICTASCVWTEFLRRPQAQEPVQEQAKEQSKEQASKD
jgi:hypothetical protein